ncbi:MAG: hypothetical protein HOP07_08040 [Bacteriovoracaceae bacterium]|nr:hypothetical protein [Bacteriovoracaceae bacterium]
MKQTIFLLILVILASCSKEIEKPAITIGKYSNQSFQITEVVNKLMSEPDVKVMNKMADGVEATRAINCDAVGEECNVYYEFLNKVVDLTKDNELSEKDRSLLENLRKKLTIELEKSDLKIQDQWKQYINSEK